MKVKSIVLVTGASSGIGLALAKQFLEKGFKVYGTTRKPVSADAQTGHGIAFLPLDVTDQPAQQECISLILKREGHIDILVNNAGFGLMGPLAEIPDSEMKRQFETNFFGLASMNRFVIPCMIEQGSGIIVNISSISGVMPSAFSGAYCASKAAVNAYSDSLRMELKPFGIKVLTVQPGGIRSNFGENAFKNMVFDNEHSIYLPIATFVEKRALISQDKATPAEVLAKRLYKEIVKPSPAAVIRIGKSSFIYPFLKRWIPTALLDNMVSGTFGLNRINRSKPGR
jgi:short-subunit dehydrogenase